MIRFRLGEMLEEKGQSSYWLSRETNIAESVLWRMRHAKTQGIQWDTLNRLCKALDCTPGDLIIFEPDERLPEGKRAAKSSKTVKSVKAK